MRRIFLTVFICWVSLFVWANNTAEEKSDIEYAINQINRICPTYIWDSWTFKEISYDGKNNTVVFVIQFESFSEDKEHQIKEKGRESAEGVIENFKEAYSNITSNHVIVGDGDIMLYLSIGNLLHQMAKTNTSLNIVFMKPDCESIIGEIPLKLNDKDF